MDVPSPGDNITHVSCICVLTCQLWNLILRNPWRILKAYLKLNISAKLAKKILYRTQNYLSKIRPAPVSKCKCGKGDTAKGTFETSLSFRLALGLPHFDSGKLPLLSLI